MEIIDYAERLLSIQRGRSRAYAALFHCAFSEKLIRWVETREVAGEFISRISRPASLQPGCDGQRQLLTMLSKSSKDLGRDFPRFEQPVNGQSLQIRSLIGEGATSKVYAAALGEIDGVVKVMKHGYQHIAQQEKKVLDYLNASGIAGLYQCLQVSPGVLFFDQIFRPFDGTFSCENVAEILDCLEHVHAAGVTHRDLRPENIMEDAGGTLHIIDWGFAILEQDVGNLDSPPPFQGTFRFGSEEVVKAAQNEMVYRYKAKDDLESFVKTVIAVNSGKKRILLRALDIPQGDFQAALDLWSEERQLHGSLFDRLFQAAHNNDYASLRRNLVY